jgi:hypothetical protein
MEVGQSPNWGCSANGKKKLCVQLMLVLKHYDEEKTFPLNTRKFFSGLYALTPY